MPLGARRKQVRTKATDFQTLCLCGYGAAPQTVLLQPLHFVKGSPNYILMPVPQL